MIKKISPFFVLLLVFNLSACKETKQKETKEPSLLERKIPNERQVDRFASTNYHLHGRVVEFLHGIISSMIVFM